MKLPSRANSLTALQKLREDFDRVLQNIWSGEIWEGEVLPGTWIPSVDVAESDREIEVKVDLPGVKAEDVELEVSENELTIRGAREEERETETKSYHRIERSCGGFFRRIILPTSADTGRIEATSHDGVITITIPKRAECQPRSVDVRRAEESASS